MSNDTPTRRDPIPVETAPQSEPGAAADPLLAGFLARNGLLEAYEPLHRGAITVDVIHTLTEQDLVELGVSSIGIRRRLLKVLQAESRATTKPAADPTSSAPANYESKFETSAEKDSLAGGRYTSALIALVLVGISPLLPWLRGGISALDLASAAGEITSAVYAIYLIPASALLCLPFAFQRTLPKAAAIVVGILPILVLLTLYSISRDIDVRPRKFLSVLSFGPYAAVIAGIAFALLYTKQSKAVRPTHTSL